MQHLLSSEEHRTKGMKFVKLSLASVELLIAVFSQVFALELKNPDPSKFMIEAKAVGPQILAERKKKAKSCSFPEFTEDEEIVVVSAYEGNSISTVTVIDADNVTFAANVNIESGTKPIVVIGSFYHSIILRFSGAIERIKKLVISDDIGVEGLADTQLYFVGDRKCLPGYLKTKSTKQMARGLKTLSKSTGMKLNEIVGHYDINTISLPSGKLSEPLKKELILNKDSRLRRIQQDFHNFNPAGLAEIDVSKVKSKHGANEYDVLPQEAGLLQLFSEGALVFTPEGYLINKPIKRFPAGLAGAHSVRFILKDGLDIPAGDPLHSPVIHQKTKKCLVGMMCNLIAK